MAGAGSLRTYLGTAPGVGKTFAMLAEGRRRAQAGDKVVVGWLEPQDRAGTSLQAGALDMLPPRTISYRGAVFADFDALAAIASGADVVLVDELAHATPDRSRQRWEDVADGLTRRPAPDLPRHRELTAGLGGTYTKIQGDAVARSLAEAARAQGAATVVVGRHRSRLTELAHGSVSSRLRRLLPAIAIEEVGKP